MACRAGAMKAFALLGHLFGNFFLPIARRSMIGFTERISRDLARDLHDLFLVEDHAIGFFQNLPFRSGRSYRDGA